VTRRGEFDLVTQELLRAFLDATNTIAVVGASRDPEKYGHQVYADLKTAGYAVFPVNPKCDRILGDTCYPDLERLPVIPDVVNLVVPPHVTEEVVKTCHALGVKKVWMQPGAESETAIRYCEEKGIAVVHSLCVMIQRRGVSERA
jgi:predicted CoA-binding protein